MRLATPSKRGDRIWHSATTNLSQPDPVPESASKLTSPRLLRTSLLFMSRIPPSLLYLTIYNPTLKPALLDPDNEDAEEQAHILFYTAREHAVSRDRILRQVGLAKALVNFSE